MQPDAEILTAAGQKLAAKTMPEGRLAECLALVDRLGNLLGTDIPLVTTGEFTQDATQHAALTTALGAMNTTLGSILADLAGGTAESITLDTAGLDNFTAPDVQTLVEQLDPIITSILGRLDALEA